MPAVIVKRYNGTSWDEYYPKTTHTQIIATGTPSSTTYLRGDGAWATPTIPSIPSVMDTTEGNTGTATTQRTINAANLKAIILNHSPAGARTPTAHDQAYTTINNIPTGNILGRNTASTGAAEAITYANLKSYLSLNNVTNESKATMFTNPTFTGTVSGVTKTHVGLSYVTNDAQIKKRASSTDGYIPTWNGITGDALNDGYSVQTTLASSTTAIPRADAVKTAVDAKANVTYNGVAKTNISYSLSGTTLTVTFS